MAEQRSAEPSPADVLIGLTAVVLGTVAPVARFGLRAAGGIVRTVVPAATAHELAARGTRVRADAVAFAEWLVPTVVERVLGMLDLTGIVERHVDLDAVVATVDIPAVLAALDPAAVEAFVDRLDLDAIVAKVDIPAVVESLDPAAVEALVARLDLDAIVARVDIPAVLVALDPAAVDTVVARVDIDAVIGRLDLAGLAQQVIDAVDLPGIVRESTGGITVAAVRDVRSQSAQADDAVDRFVSRLLRRSPGTPRIPLPGPRTEPEPS